MDKKNKKIPNDLIGFQEFIEKDSKLFQHRNQPSPSSGFELLSFLEHESIRLSKTIELCEDQVYTVKSFPQHEEIQLKQDQIINKNKSILVEILSRKDSPLTKNLHELLSFHFSNSREKDKS